MDGIIVDKYSEVKYTLGTSCNEEITKREKYKEESKVRANARIRDWV